MNWYPGVNWSTTTIQKNNLDLPIYLLLHAVAEVSTLSSALVKGNSSYFRGRFHEKSQTEPDSRLSQGLKSETFVSAEFLAQMDFTKGGSAETSLKLWSLLFNLISYI